MKRKLLHKYFKNESTDKELKKILEWTESSEKNRYYFLSERKLWNIKSIHLQETKKDSRSISTKSIINYAAFIAAVCLLLVGFSHFQTNRTGNYQVVNVPIGQRVNIVLADGTSVWLNSNTTLTYPVRFGKNIRQVKVNGEAYFEVAHNDNCPFVVDTEKYQIKALGTTFNVKAYSDYGMFETALIDGSVRIIDKMHKVNLLLKPNERVFEEMDRLYVKKGLSNEDYLWKNGLLVFNDEPIRTVLELLSAYYGMKISLENEKIKNYRCTSKFLYNNGLDYILKVLQRDLHYEIQKDSVNNRITLQ